MIEGSDLICTVSLFLPPYTPYMPPRTKSGPGQCSKCDRSYSDLLEHINKRHQHDRFQQSEVEDYGLTACVCGRVVRNHNGLSKHQSRFGCLALDNQARRVQQSDTTPARISTSSLSSIPTGTSSLTTLPSVIPSTPPSQRRTAQSLHIPGPSSTISPAPIPDATNIVRPSPFSTPKRSSFLWVPPSIITPAGQRIFNETPLTTRLQHVRLGRPQFLSGEDMDISEEEETLEVSEDEEVSGELVEQDVPVAQEDFLVSDSDSESGEDAEGLDLLEDDMLNGEDGDHAIQAPIQTVSISCDVVLMQ
jgi:hypothetical protein